MTGTDVSDMGRAVNLVVSAEELRRARADTRSVKSIAKAETLESLQALADWTSSPEGIRNRDRPVYAVPSLAPHVPDMVAVPTGPYTTVNYYGMGTGEHVSRIVGVLRRRDHFALREVFMSWYERLHATVLHDTLPPLPSPEPLKNKKPACRDALVCLCGPDGTKAHQFKLQFCNAIKRLFARKGVHDKFVSGDVIFRLTAHSQPDGDGNVAMLTDIFIHSSYGRQSPFSPSWRKCSLLGVNQYGNMEVKGTRRLWVLYELRIYLVTSCTNVATWKLRLHELVQSSRPVHLLDPKIAELYVACDEHVWSTERTRRQQAADALDLLGGDSDDVDVDMLKDGEKRRHRRTKVATELSLLARPRSQRVFRGCSRARVCSCQMPTMRVCCRTC